MKRQEFIKILKSKDIKYKISKKGNLIITKENMSFFIYML